MIPGIPDRTVYGDLTDLKPGMVAYLIRQKHDADRARLHEDLRIGTPSGLYSWAVPKFMPVEDNVKRLAVRQPMHTWDYKDFQGKLKHGYGKGTVEKLEESPVVILKNTGDHLVFTRGDTRNAPVYQLIRTKDRNWLLFTKKPEQPVEVTSYSKEHFRQVPVEDIPALITQGAEVSRKIDGAGVLAYLGKHGIEAYGIRPNAEGIKPSYTDIIGGLRSVQVPVELQGTLLRGEIFGQQGKRTIGANELSGLLNSTVRNAAYKKQGEGIKLLIAGLAYNKDGKDIYDQERVNEIIARLGNTPVVPMERYAGKDALRAYKRMTAGADPLTSEGFVLHIPGKRPVKAKYRTDSDVVIRRIFKADTGKDERAGGFEYSLPDDERIIGRVGTGFSHEMLKDMLADPDAYIGRTARIHSQEQYPSGAYRAPGFITLKED